MSETIKQKQIIVDKAKILCSEITDLYYIPDMLTESHPDIYNSLYSYIKLLESEIAKHVRSYNDAKN